MDVNSVEALAVTVAFIAVAAGAISSASSSLIQKLSGKANSAKRLAGKVSGMTAKRDETLAEASRLDDLREAQQRSRTSARISSFSYNSLIFAQYIIGALLASSFVQQSFSANLIGILGVLVLLSSAIQQRFRPDVIAIHAKSQTIRANRMIRAIEDMIFLVKTDAKHAPTIYEIRETASKSLSELEDAELVGVGDYFDKRSVSENTDPEIERHSGK